MAGKTAAAKAAAKTTAAAAKALAAEKEATVWRNNALAADDNEEETETPKKTKPKAKPKAAKEPKEPKEPKEKRTRAPSAFNLYMKARLAEMKTDDTIMSEYPNHKQRFTLAAGEWSAMTDEEKAAKKAEFDNPIEPTPPPKKQPTKAPGAPLKPPANDSEDSESESD